MEENKKDVLPLEGEPLTAPQISEPVVNALAAALSKIETYVPTQYINDGPPDIDAEHLNHAEQAIMRVTNLANGAADAISALQSQVTQLNSDMSKFDVYHRDVTGSLNDDKIIQTALEDFKTSIVTNKPILVEIQNHLGGRALAVGIQSLSNYNSFLVITYYDRPKEFVYALNHWEVYELVTKSDLTFYKHPLNMTVKMSGKLESIAEWLKNNTTYFGVYNYIRVQEPIDSDGYFGNSSFDIVWNFSSLNYGWITLRSDNPKSIIFGRLVAGKAEWDIPVFKSI